MENSETTKRWTHVAWKTIDLDSLKVILYRIPTMVNQHFSPHRGEGDPNHWNHPLGAHPPCNTPKPRLCHVELQNKKRKPVLSSSDGQAKLPSAACKRRFRAVISLVLSSAGSSNDSLRQHLMPGPWAPGLRWWKVTQKKKEKGWILGGGNSKIFYFHPECLGKWSNLTSIFFKWVGSTTK